MAVKFISYTHGPSCLCKGVLTLEINGEEMRFGHDMKDYTPDGWNDTNYEIFWYTNGSARFSRRGNPIIKTNPWGVSEQKLPEEIREYADEIEEVINDNIEWGCCGGCL